MRPKIGFGFGVALACVFGGMRLLAQQGATPATTEGDFVVHNFAFHSGEALAEVRLHYTTLGKPARDAQGRTTNAVLILHGTGRSGQQFLAPYFAGELFGAGQLLEPAAQAGISRRGRCIALRRPFGASPDPPGC